jgi:tetratricopeptide (TPR) repeat protein
MATGRSCLLLGLLALGCQSLIPLEPPSTPPAHSAAETARQLWELGQRAMERGEPEEALRCYDRCLALDPKFDRIHLSLAAAHLEMGDEVAACPHLARYVEAFPDQYLIRLHLAELLLKVDERETAIDHFEQCVADAQEKGELALSQLIHCHAQLMDLAEEDEDVYHEHLHRGIGLMILARRRGGLADVDCDLTVEELLCKAAAELTLAHLDRPDEARPTWYLYEVWNGLAQNQPAQRFLRAASDAAPFTYLTANELRSLHIACQCQALTRSMK